MAIPTGGSKRKGSPVEQPAKRAKNSQFKSFPKKQAFDNAAVKGALKHIKKAGGPKKLRDKVLNTIKGVKLP